MASLYASTGQRDRALQQYRHLREVLAVELDAEPEESSQHLYDAILTGRFADVQPRHEGLPAPRHNIPLALTSFVGWAREVAQVKEPLSTVRPLTLTGVGGAGKTRLRLRAGWDLLSCYPEGVWLVGFASLTDPELVPTMVAGDATLDLISRLVDKSLVSARGAMGDVVRYRLLEPVRQYAHELLETDER